MEAKVLPEKANANNDVTWSFTGSESYLSLSPDGKILGKTLKDDLFINAYLLDGSRTRFTVKVQDFSWDNYSGTIIPTYTSVTGVEVESLDYQMNAMWYRYKYTSDSDVTKYHQALLNKGFTVCDYNYDNDDRKVTTYDTNTTDIYYRGNIRYTGKIICQVIVTPKRVTISHYINRYE